MNLLTEGTSWRVATARALMSAVVVGGLGFLAVWSTTTDVRTLIIAGLTPGLTTLAVRLGIEGYLDRPGGYAVSSTTKPPAP